MKTPLTKHLHFAKLLQTERNTKRKAVFFRFYFRCAMIVQKSRFEFKGSTHVHR